MRTVAGGQPLRMRDRPSGLRKVGSWKLLPSSPSPGLAETETEKKTKQKGGPEKALICLDSVGVPSAGERARLLCATELAWGSKRAR